MTVVSIRATCVCHQNVHTSQSAWGQSCSHVLESKKKIVSAEQQSAVCQLFSGARPFPNFPNNRKSTCGCWGSVLHSCRVKLLTIPDISVPRVPHDPNEAVLSHKCFRHSFLLAIYRFCCCCCVLFAMFVDCSSGFRQTSEQLNISQSYALKKYYNNVIMSLSRLKTTTKYINRFFLVHPVVLNSLNSQKQVASYTRKILVDKKFRRRALEENTLSWLSR